VKDKIFQWVISICLLVLLGIAAAGGCGRVAGQKGEEGGTIVRQQAIEDSKFAVYGQFPVNVKPEMDTLPLAPELSKMTSKDFIKLSKTDKEILDKNGFVVLHEKSAM